MTKEQYELLLVRLTGQPVLIRMKGLNGSDSVETFSATIQQGFLREAGAFVASRDKLPDPWYVEFHVDAQFFNTGADITSRVDLVFHSHRGWTWTLRDTHMTGPCEVLILDKSGNALAEVKPDGHFFT